jgi:hypothetical protein
LDENKAAFRQIDQALDIVRKKLPPGRPNIATTTARGYHSTQRDMG